jgi:hypothetical protein
MNPGTRTRRGIAFTLIVACGLCFAARAGELEPPGAPGPTMRTLDQIEARIPIGQPEPGGFPIVLDQPGSYFLASNVHGEAGADGIQIISGGVSIDLNGFAMIGAPGQTSFNAITVPMASVELFNLSIRNGTIEGWGGDGLCAASPCGDGNNVQLRDVRVRGNAGAGIRTARKSTIQDCLVSDNGSTGIDVTERAIIRNCVVTENGSFGIYTIADTTIEGCTIHANRSYGVSASGSLGRTFIRNNEIGYNTLDGILVSFWAVIRDNFIYSNGHLGNGAGIHLQMVGGSGRNHVEGNVLMWNDRGIDAQSDLNLIIRNSAQGNGTSSSDDYVIIGGNTVGAIITGGSGAFSSDQPWANFSF